MISQKTPDCSSGHAATDYFASYDREYRSVDSSFWKIVDGARQPGASQLRPYAYGLQGEVRAAIVKHPKISHYLFSKALARERQLRTPETEIQSNCEKFAEDVTLDICILAAFRSSKFVVRIDPTIEAQLASTEVPASLHSASYLKLPTWSFFLEFGDALKSSAPVFCGYDGAFVTVLDHGSSAGQVVVKTISSDGIPPLVLLHNIDTSVPLRSDWVEVPRSPESTELELMSDALPAEDLMRFVVNACLFLTSDTCVVSGGGMPELPSREKSFYGAICKEMALQVLTLGLASPSSAGLVGSWSVRTGPVIPGTSAATAARLLKHEWKVSQKAE